MNTPPASKSAGPWTRQGTSRVLASAFFFHLQTGP